MAKGHMKGLSKHSVTKPREEQNRVGVGCRSFRGRAGVREDGESTRRPCAPGRLSCRGVGASEERRGRGGRSVQSWTGSIQGGNHMHLASSMEKWKQLRLRLHISWVQIRAPRLTVRLADSNTYCVGLSSSEPAAWDTAVTVPMLAPSPPGHHGPPPPGEATSGRASSGDW